MDVVEMAKQYVEIVRRQISEEQERLDRNKEMIQEHENFIADLHIKLASGIQQISEAEKMQDKKEKVDTK